MLSIGVLGVGTESYYSKLASEDYYLQSGEPPGEWWGGAADGLGLQGVVGSRDLSSLCRGFAPRGGRSLVRNAGSDKRRAAFDLTFSAPKSVSVLWSQAGKDERCAIEQAHRDAVVAALYYVEDVACFSRRGRGGAERVKACLAAALFPHSTARSVGGVVPDPQLHTHALVMNVSLGDDARVGTLDARHLFRHKMTAGVLYRAELFALLRERLHLETVQAERAWELRGVPRGLCRHFSKRRRAIEARLAAKGKVSAIDAARAARETRCGKSMVERAAFLADWTRQGLEFGFWAQDVARCTPPRSICDASLRAAEQRALSGLTEVQSNFTERELLRAVAEELEGAGVSVARIRRRVGVLCERLVLLRQVRGELSRTA